MTNRILFFTDTWFFNFCTAVYLQKKYDGEFFAIIDVDDKARKFFESQDLVKYKKTWFFLENCSNFYSKPDMNYLKSFEKKYGINLWSIAYMDRNFYQFNPFHKFSSDEILSIIEKECKFFDQILEEVKPNFLSIYITIQHYHELLCQMCRSKGVKILMLGPSKIGYKMMVSERPLIMDNMMPNENNTKERKLSELQNYLNDFSPNKITNEYITKHFQNNIWQRYKHILKFFLSARTSSFHKRYSNFGRTKTRILQNKISIFWKKKFRTKFINNYFINSVNDQIPFIYFPLHQEPERNLLIDSPYCSNQVEVIKNIAKSLPVEYKLLVKEHPIQKIWGWRNLSYYKEIMKIPNVVMVHPSVKHDIMLKKCSMIITITGSAGMEALFYKKPVITFTENFYSSVPTVVKLEKIEDLQKLIQKTLTTHEPNLKDLNDFVNMIEKNTFPANEPGMTADFSYKFGFKGPIMDSFLPLNEIKLFLEEHKLDFERMANEHLEKIQYHKKNNIKSYGQQ